MRGEAAALSRIIGGYDGMDVSNAIVHILEEERRRFARDLHDGPVQVLSNTSMRLDMLSQLMAVDVVLAEEEIRRLHRRLVQATTEIRQLIYDLQPVAIDAMGLGAALTALARRVEKDWGVPVTIIVVEGGPRLDADQEMILYRAVQEAVTNAAKHSGARSIDIRFDQDPDGASCTVADDGRGFDASHPVPGHYGLQNIAERLRLVGGTFSIETGEGQGTRVMFSVPTRHV